MEEIIQNQGPEMVPAADAEQQERMRRDVREFVNEFPGVKATDIAPEVWTEVRSGKSLVSAYRGHRERQLRQENRQLRERLDQETRNADNRRRSLGSQRSSGQNSGRDAFVEALLGGDSDTI